MIDLDELIAEAREFADRNNGLNWQGMVRDLADALEVATGERDDLATRLSEYLCDSTGGLLSKTGYDVRTMVAHTEEYYDRVHAEERKEVEAERDAAVAATEARIERWMQLVGKGVEERMTAEAERDAALARVEELEADMERCEGLKAAHMRSVHETVNHNEELLARIAEAAKLHRPDWSDWGIDHPEEGASCSCGANYSYDECPTRIALGLNEGDNDEV